MHRGGAGPLSHPRIEVATRPARPDGRCHDAYVVRGVEILQAVQTAGVVEADVHVRYHHPVRLAVHGHVLPQAVVGTAEVSQVPRSPHVQHPRSFGAQPVPDLSLLGTLAVVDQYRRRRRGLQRRSALNKP